MRSSTSALPLMLLSALPGIVSGARANVKRQELDFAGLLDAQTSSAVYTAPPVAVLSQSVSFDPSSAASSAAAAIATAPVTINEQIVSAATSDVTVAAAPSAGASLSKRGVNDPCAQQPDGFGPDSTPATVEGFQANPEYANIALAAPTPAGYSNAFAAKTATVQGLIYLGLTTFKTYDTNACATLCNNKEGCQSFNIYFERDPSLNAAAACPNPAPMTNVKCTLWGFPVDAVMTTNVGETRYQFMVVMAGSNGYNKKAACDELPNYTQPIALPGAINAPLLQGKDTYMGYKTWADSAYSATQCAALCQAQTDYNKRHPKADGTFDSCMFFNIYILNKNNFPQGTFCSMYTDAWNATYATNVGQWRGTDHYTISQSFIYTNSAYQPASNVANKLVVSSTASSLPSSSPPSSSAPAPSSAPAMTDAAAGSCTNAATVTVTQTVSVTSTVTATHA